MRSDGAPEAASAFELLSDETRVRIITELATRRAETPARPELAFMELRERVGVRDTGQFNYHLKRLRGEFVEKTDGGYALTPTGARVGAMLLNESTVAVH